MVCVAISRKDVATLGIYESVKKTVRAASIRVGELASATAQTHDASTCSQGRSKSNLDFHLFTNLSKEPKYLQQYRPQCSSP